MYNPLNNFQEQRIINVVECMRVNDISSMELEFADNLIFYLSSYIYTTELSVKENKKVSGIWEIYWDRYTIDKDNHINYVDSEYEIE